MTRMKKKKLLIYKSIAPEKWIREALFRIELLLSKKVGARKAFVARNIAGLKRLKKKKPLWIITDRLNKAGDNGEAFFDYLVSTKFDKADYLFAITECDD